MPELVYSEIKIGDGASLSLTITEARIVANAGIDGTAVGKKAGPKWATCTYPPPGCTVGWP
jgi:hypothetical protein